MNDTFGDRLKAARKGKGLVQKQLAEATGVGQAAIANYEKGQRFPGEDVLKRLTEVLDVSLDHLFSVSSRERQPKVSESWPSGKLTAESEMIQELLKMPFDKAYRHILARMPSQAHSQADFYGLILIPLLQTIGKLWQTGDLSVAEEHIITAKVREMIVLYRNVQRDSLLSSASSEGSWLGFSAPGDEHDMALLMLSQIMAERGWDSVFLGIGPPLPSLIDAIDMYQPDVIAVSIALPIHWNGLEAYLMRIINSKPRHSRIIIGGQGLSGHQPEAERLDLLIAESFNDGIELAYRR